MALMANGSTIRPLTVNILGGGVVGMTSALVLALEGHRVNLWRAHHWGRTTSSVAAAYWRPVTVGKYARSWATATYHFFRSLEALSSAEIGISTRNAVEYLELANEAELRREIDSIWWKNLPGIDFNEKPVGRSPQVFRDESGETQLRVGFTFRTPVVRMPDYLAWLQRQLYSAGVTITERAFESLADAADLPGDCLVHCSGFAAPHLVASKDPQEIDRCVPREGVVISVQAPEVNELVGVHGGRFQTDPIYIVPRKGSSNDVILGGCVVARPGYRDWLALPSPDLAMAARILQRCKAVHPGLEHLTDIHSESIVAVHAGMRPWRDAVRVESDHRYAKPVFHNYGHGGAGVTLSFGCALAVADWARGL